MLHVSKETANEHLSKRKARKQRKLARLEQDIKTNVCNSTVNTEYDNCTNYLRGSSTYWKHENKDGTSDEKVIEKDGFNQPTKTTKIKPANNRRRVGTSNRKYYTLSIHMPLFGHIATNVATLPQYT